MIGKVFFSFDYNRDFWRVSQIRNYWLEKPDRETAGFVETAAGKRDMEGEASSAKMAGSRVGKNTSNRCSNWLRNRE